MGILVLPTEDADCWKRAVAATATKQGWLFSQSPPTETSVPSVHVSDRWADIAAFDPSYLVVILSDSVDVIRYFAKSDSAVAAIRTASHFLALAEAVSTIANQVVRSDRYELEIPGFGVVVLEPATDTHRTSKPRFSEALSFYDIGASTPNKSLWPMELFEIPGAAHDNEGPVSLDVTGLARDLVYGPYLELPPGEWMATFCFSINTHGVSVPLTFSWGPNGDSVITTHRIKQSGLYEVTLSRVWNTPNITEFRLYTTHAALAGNISPISCEVERIHSPIAPELAQEIPMVA
ncbi:hypothetical protein [Brevundimonas vesicularis]|uniref:hypothetical protein n=1 Tax=Brevundimonas vesicularis TaxID=41276 RepID=UPI0027D7836B|nr:hypothetical protein [Brevundimonas vesicularis]